MFESELESQHEDPKRAHDWYVQLRDVDVPQVDYRTMTWGETSTYFALISEFTRADGCAHSRGTTERLPGADYFSGFHRETGPYIS
jgi:hypothetical protein